MNKLWLMISLVLFPIMALADNALSFAPPPSDYSVVFLSNIFGIVDGVLHGNGSQMLGNLFAVFNAAVLALGGMIIMYTLIVSTLNTAQEGEMLGKKWSSIWIPVRSTIGLALLIPKASGYCLMQIFVMWVVVQGVGAADKIWDAALSYLNRGGVIIKANSDPTLGLINPDGGLGEIAKGANQILASAVCMIGLQTQLQNQRQLYLSQKGGSSPSGPCSGTPSPSMEKFCNTAVPNFINTVNVVDYQNTHKGDSLFNMPLPYFTDGIYSDLTGVCGKLVWKPFTKDFDQIKTDIGALTESDIETAKMSRAIAVQQLFTDLSMVAQTMIRNNPGTFSPPQYDKNHDYSEVAIQQFGVPLNINGANCSNNSEAQCILWGSDLAKKGNAPLFNGTEFRGAILDYNGIMLPSLTLIEQGKKIEASKGARQFIRKASSEGWIMAGSYFFNLITLNVKASEISTNLVDTDTGLDGSEFKMFDELQKTFNNVWDGHKCSDTNKYRNICVWFSADSTPIRSILGLINNYNLKHENETSEPSFSRSTISPIYGDVKTSTVFGFTTNSMVLKLPNQPGQDPLKFATGMNIRFDSNIETLPTLSFNCGEFKIWGLSAGCIGRVMADIFYNNLFVPLYNALIVAFGEIIMSILHAFLVLPLAGMAVIFKKGLDIVAKPGVNPIVALAQMGTYYINYASNLWLVLIFKSITASLIPIFGIFIGPLIALGLPLLAVWLGVMVAVGINTAYYVPMVPYMIFTFGSIGWLMSVIESMVAAPIVALGVTHPEGHEAFGKGETAIMILLNVFLRPSMMIIGYIAAIALSYVSVWIINAGFDNAIGFIQGSEYFGTSDNRDAIDAGSGGVQGGYQDWAGIYAYFFSILVYTMIYITVVTKAFTLIAVLPDKVLRWVGGSPESYGTDTSQWGDETKQKLGEAATKTQEGQGQIDKKLTAATTKKINQGVGAIKSAASKVTAQGNTPKPSTPTPPQD